MKQRICAAAIAAALTLTSVAVASDASLSAYQPVAGLSGQLKSVGSETLGREMERWAKGFMTLYPDVKIDVEAKGSATAPATLLRGISQFAPISRFRTSDEAGAFEKKYGARADLAGAHRTRVRAVLYRHDRFGGDCADRLRH